MPFTEQGKKMMASMRKTYGDDAEKVFYATMNKRDMKGVLEMPGGHSKNKRAVVKKDKKG